MSLLRHILTCNAYDPSDYLPFFVDTAVIGFVGTNLARRLQDFAATIETTETGLRLAGSLDSVEARSAAIQDLSQRLAESGDVRPLDGEVYAAVTAWGRTPAFTVDRAMVPALGLKAFGLHVNGFVANGLDPAATLMWIGRRADDRRVAPGKLDNLIAGGQPHGLSLTENLIKEGAEEAGFDPQTLSRARPAGAITYTMAQPEGLRRDTLFVFDLALDAETRPHNQDGEMSGFACLPVPEVAELVRETDRFKFNVPLVILDFLIRHGHITADEPDYLALVAGLRQQHPPAPILRQ